MPTWKKPPRYIDALWLLALAIYILAGAAIVPFHGDESTLIFMGRDYFYLFDRGDLSEILYDEGRAQRRDEQGLRLLNGTVSKTIYGWLAQRNGLDADALNGHWHWGQDWGFNLSTGRLPDSRLLNAARLSSAVQLALAAAAFFQFVALTLNRPSAYLASALFALHPNMLINGRRAMMEGSHILGLLLLLLAAAWLVRERTWWRYALLGVCAGFALAAKHPNVILCALVFPACAVGPFYRLARSRGAEWGRAALDLSGLALAGAITALLFLALNPAWWSAPLEMPALIASLRAELLQIQVELFGGYRSFAEQVDGFFQFIFAGRHQYFEVAQWAGYDVIGAQIAAYESSGLAGLPAWGSNLAGLVWLLLTFAGAVMLARDSRIAAEYKMLFLFWIIGSALMTLWLTPLPWARYYLPLVPAFIVLASHALVTIAAMVLKRVNAQSDGIAVLA